MLIEKIRCSLVESRTTKDVVLFKEAYSLIQSSLENEVLGVNTLVSPEFIILCVETAIEVGEIATAKSVLEEFMLSRPPKNQYLTRGYFALAVIGDIENKDIVGSDRVAKILQSIAHIQKGVDLIMHDKRCNFLVYNASIHYRRISRPLFVPHRIHHLLPSFKIMVNALESINDFDYEWRITNLVHLALCYSHLGNVAEAVKCVQMAHQIASTSAPQMKKYTLLASIHVVRGKPDLYQKLKADTFSAKEVSSVDFKPLFLLQSIRSGITTNPATIQKELLEAAVLMGVDVDALITSDGVNNNILTAPGLPTAKTPEKASRKSKQQQQQSVPNIVIPPPSASQQQQAAAAVAPSSPKKKKTGLSKDAIITNASVAGKEELIAEIGRMAFAHNMPELANRCALVAGTSKTIKPRILSEMILCELHLLQLGAEAEKYTAGMITIRVDYIKRLERVLAPALTLEDPVLVEDICIAIWNGSFPLLQNNLRSHVVRSFEKVARALEEIDSLLLPMRAQLYLELAKCNVKDDILAKAKVEVEKALALDYEQVEDKERSLDRHLLPLHRKLNLRTKIYRLFERSEDQASLLIEQAQEAKEIGLKSTLLDRALHTLQQASTVVVSASMETAPYSNYERALLLANIMKAAWASHLAATVLKCAPLLLNTEWDIIKERDIVRLQAEMHYIETEAKLLLHYHSITGEVNKDGEKKGKILASIATGFNKGIRLGLKLKEDILTINGAMYVWNYFLSYFQRNEFVDFVDTITETYQLLWPAMAAFPTMCPDLIYNIANAVICGLDQQQSQQQQAQQATESQPQILKVIEEISKNVLTRVQAISFVAKKNFITTISRIQRVKNMNFGLKYDDESFIIAELEHATAVNGSNNNNNNSRNNMLTKCMQLLQESPNVSSTCKTELYACLAKVSLSCADPNLSLQLADNALKCSRLAIPEGASMVFPSASRPTAIITKTDTKEWRWLSVAECLKGQSIYASINPAAQEKSRQDELLLKSIIRFAWAAIYGCRSQMVELILVAARHFWNTAIPFMHTAATRATITAPLQAIIEHMPEKLDENIEPDNIEVCVNLFVLLFECMSDQERWQDGALVVEASFKALPVQYHKALWMARISFFARMGRDIRVDMYKLKDYDAETQAKVWATLARSASNKKDQYQAYNATMEALQDDPIQQVEYRIEFAEWLFCSGLDIHYAKEQLQGAADVLLFIEHSAEITVLEEKDGLASVEDESNSGNNNKGQPNAPTNISKARSKSGMSAIHSRGAGTIKTHSVGSKSVSDDNNSGGKNDKAASVGNNNNVADEGVKNLNVWHLEMLCRVYMMLSRMADKHEERAEYSLMAHYYIMRMLESTITTKSDGENAALPGQLIDWASFEIPSAVHAEASKGTDPNCINRKSIARPELFYAYAKYLIQTLTKIGYHLQCIPILMLLQIVARDILNLPILSTLIKLQLFQLLESLHLTAEAAGFAPKLEEIKLTSAAKRIHMEEVKQRLLIRQYNENNFNNNSSSNIPAKKTGAKDNTNTNVRVLGPIRVHEVWVQLASILINLGYFSVASDLVHEALVHSRAFEDSDSEGECLHLLGKLAFLRGDAAAAIEFETSCFDFWNVFESWERSAVNMAIYYRHSALRNTNRSQTFINSLIDALKTHKNSARVGEAMQCKAGLLLVRAEVILHQAERDVVSLVQTQVNVGNAIRDYEEAIDLLSTYAGGLQLVQVLTNYGKFLQRPACAASSPSRQTLYLQIKRFLQVAEREGLACLSTVAEQLPHKTLVLPCAKLLCEIQMMLSEVELALGPLARPPARAPIMCALGDLTQLIPSPKSGAVDVATSVSSAEEKSLMHATSAHNLSQSMPRMQCRTLFHIGLSLKTLLNNHKSSQKSNGNIHENLALDYFAQSKESLSQSVALAVLYEDVDTLLAASFALIDLLGSNSKSAAVTAATANQSFHFLAQAQSFSAQKLLRSLMRDFVSGGGLECLYMKKIDFLAATLAEPQTSSEYRDATQYMEKHSQAYKMTMILPNVSASTILQMLPSNMQVILLEVSQDVIVGASVATTAGAVPTVASLPFNHALLYKIKQNLRRFSQKSVQILSERKKREFTDQPQQHAVPAVAVAEAEKSSRLHHPLSGKSPRSTILSQRKVLALNSNNNGNTPKGEDRSYRSQEVENSMQAEYRYIVEDVYKLLMPILTELQVTSSSASSSSVLKVKQVMLLSSNMDLQELPLEGLTVFLDGPISFSRDFSLHVLERRLARMSSSAQSTDKKADSPRTTPRSERKAAAAAAAAAIPPRSESFHLDNTAGAVIIDPRHEDEDEYLLNAVVQRAPKWTCLAGANGIPSTSQWQQTILSSKEFMYFGYGRVLGYLPPKFLAGLDISHCNTAFILDRLINDTYYYTQMKLDISKTEKERNLENPVPTAILLSLQGAKTIVINQWGTTLAANLHFLKSLFGGGDGGTSSFSSSGNKKSGNNNMSSSNKATLGEIVHAHRNSLTTFNNTAQDLWLHQVQNPIVFGLPHGIL